MYTKSGQYYILKIRGGIMSGRYSDEFKLSVIEDYYNSALGVRSIALKYNLPLKARMAYFEGLDYMQPFLK